MGPLFEHLGSFWSILGPGRAKYVFSPPMLIDFGGFWRDSGAIWEAKSEKKWSKIDTKNHSNFDLEISWFLMIYGRYVKSKTIKNHWFFNGFVQIVFL